MKGTIDSMSSSLVGGGPMKTTYQTGSQTDKTLLSPNLPPKLSDNSPDRLDGLLSYRYRILERTF